MEDPLIVDGIVPDAGAGTGAVKGTVQRSEKAQAQVQWKTQCSVVQRKKGAGAGVGIGTDAYGKAKCSAAQHSD